jgi:hypothetical protein
MNNNKKYPRPKILCNDCNSYKILCWGDKIKPYLRHIKNSNCYNNHFGMSEEHEFAQDLLVEYLNNGHKLIFQKKCYCCNNITIPFNINNYIKEYTYKIDNAETNIKLSYRRLYSSKIINRNTFCRYDIAGLNHNIPLFGIEIYYTHRAENSNIRNNLPWVELNALEIIFKLDIDKYEETIILEDISCENNKNDSNNMIDGLNSLAESEYNTFINTIPK